jgi:hypothetical protein
MHQECNVVESIISMCFDFTSFTKDTMNTRKDLAEVRANSRGNLTRPRASYYFKAKERKEILR